MCENDKFGLIIEIYASIATFWLNYSCISAFMTMWNFTVRMPRVFLFSAHISDANFSASSTSGYSTTYVLDLVLPKYKVGVGNLRTEYKYSRHSHSGRSDVQLRLLWAAGVSILFRNSITFQNLIVVFQKSVTDCGVKSIAQSAENFFFSKQAFNQWNSLNIGKIRRKLRNLKVFW